MKKSHIVAMSLLTSLLLAIVAIPALAVVYVDGIDGNDANTGLLGWGDAKATIGAGVTVAAGQPDLTVVVHKTTYTENITAPAGVAVYGGFNGTEVPPFDLSARTFTPPTIVQPTAAGNTVFTCTGGNVVDGFTIRGGAALTSGLGVSVLPNTTSQVSNCIIQNFQSVLGTGAGIAAIGTALTPIGLNIFNCQFSNNSAAAGAGIYATQGNVSVTGCTFTGDTATDAFGLPPIGGASIFTSDCSLSVTGCTFTTETARVTLLPDTLVQGGAIYATGGLIVSVGTCKFTTCVATGTNAVHTAQGGALYIFGVNATVRNNFVYQCAALGTGATQPANGGGIYFHNPGILNVINNTFYGNEVTPNAGLVTDTDRPYGLGSAIFMTGSTAANIYNNIITHNRGTAVVNDPLHGMTVYFNYNVLWHNAGGDIFGFNFPFYSTNPVLNKDFNIMADPNLRGPLTGDLHILYGSPARDAGRNSGAPPTDIDGELRPNWSGVVGPAPTIPIVDIGADEFVDTGTPHKGGANNDPRGPATTDPDSDLIFNPFDNCPTTPNTTQTDSNGDRVGDTCTPLASGLTASVYYVDGTIGSSGNGQTWGAAFKTIQEGIDAADSHNQTGWTKNYEVWVRGGPAGQTYTQNIMIWHGVAVYGGWIGTELPIDSPDPHAYRDLNTNQTTINGAAIDPAVTIAQLPEDRYLAAPLKTSYDNLVTVLDGFRPNNGKGELGGGVSVYKELANISTCRIVGNTAALGGGLYFYKSNGMVGDGLLPLPATLLSGLTTIMTNTATGAATYAGYGGGVYTERGAPTIFANIIEGNTAFFGGGIASRFSSPDIMENLIGCAATGDPNVAQGNGTGNGKGGGIYIDSSSSPNMDKLTIVSNQATGGTGSGGGLYVSSSNFFIDNTIVANNTAALTGGAIFATGTSAAISDPWCYIKYSDFFANSAPQFTGISDPTSPPPAGSCAQTNFAIDPPFVNPATCAYSLAVGSTLRHAGDPADGSPNIGAFQDEDPPVTIGQAKDLDNGIIGEISNVVVTAVFTDGFYIESMDRTAGIFVRMSKAPVQVSQLVSVTGTVSTYGIEREIANPTLTITFSPVKPILPLSMGNRQVGGGPSGFYKMGITGGLGPSNLGLLIKTWGKVTSAYSGSRPYFTIDDGSRVGVKVLLPNGVNLPAVGDSVVVVGISCVDYYGVGYGRMVKARLSSDLSYPSE